MPVRAVLILYRKPGLSLDQFKTSCENRVKLIRRLVRDDAAPLSRRCSYIARKELSNDEDDESKYSGTTTERNPMTPAEEVVHTV